MKKALLAFLLVFGISAIIPSVAQAQTPLAGNPCIEGGINGVATLDCIPPLVANLVYWLIVFSGVIALFLIIFGGIKFLTSGGDQGKVESAKKTITYSIIGLVTVVSSFMVVNIIADVTGVSCISEFGFDSCEPEDELVSSERCGPTCFGDARRCGCPVQQRCRNTGEDVYTCQWRCNNTNKDKGWCSPNAAGKTRICRESTDGANDWGCRLPQD